MGLCLIKGNNILDHLRFVLLDHALFMGLIHNGNNLLLCYRRLCPVQLYPKGYSRQPGNPGDKQSKRPEHHYPEMHQLQITVCIFLRMIGTHPAKSKDSKSCKQYHTYCQNQNKSRYMLYVWTKSRHCPWHQKSTKTNSRCHDHQRDGIDKLSRPVDHLQKHPGFLVSFVRFLLCIILTDIPQCCRKPIKNAVQPQQKHQNKYAPEGHTTAVFHYAYPSPL